ncbi:MAG: DUF6732 family protein [Pseudomonadota bacterium]
MSKSISFLSVFGALISMHGTAHAHLGHLGEVAGHSHWIGIGAVAAAAAIGVLVARPRKDKPAEEAATDEDPEVEPDEEPAT